MASKHKKSKHEPIDTGFYKLYRATIAKPGMTDKDLPVVMRVFFYFTQVQYEPGDHVTVGYGDLAKQIGSSRNAVKQAISLLVGKKMLTCVSKGDEAVPGVYSLDSENTPEADDYDSYNDDFEETMSSCTNNSTTDGDDDVLAVPNPDPCCTKYSTAKNLAVPNPGTPLSGFGTAAVVSPYTADSTEALRTHHKTKTAVELNIGQFRDIPETASAPFRTFLGETRANHDASQGLKRWNDLKQTYSDTQPPSLREFKDIWKRMVFCITGRKYRYHVGKDADAFDMEYAEFGSQYSARHVAKIFETFYLKDDPFIAKNKRKFHLIKFFRDDIIEDLKTVVARNSIELRVVN